MFSKNEYRQEMEDVQASEALIDITLKKMQDECNQLKGQQKTTLFDETAYDGATRHSLQIKKSVFVTRVLPLAACLMVALLGVLAFPQVMGTSEQEISQSYEFYPVNAQDSLMGGLQFGSAGQQLDDKEVNLGYAEASEDFLPEGILEGTPVMLEGRSVYLGFDEQKETYYAAYRKDGFEGKWVLLRSDVLDKATFIEEVEIFI